VSKIFAGIARRAADASQAGVGDASAEGKLAALTTHLQRNGVTAEYSLIDGGFELREHNCPYSSVVKEHPEVCSVIHSVLDATVGGSHVQTESLATGGKECRFEIKA
jgi:predicted ArsR family transcriptional regulator